MKKEEYIENVLKHIQNKVFISTIREELEGHIADRELYYKECGYDDETSLQRAMEHMGSADAVGSQLNSIHYNEKLVKRFKICFITYIVLYLFVYLSTLAASSDYFSFVYEIIPIFARNIISVPFSSAILVIRCIFISDAISARLYNLTERIAIADVVTILTYPTLRLFFMQGLANGDFFGDALFWIIIIALVVFLPLNIIINFVATAELKAFEKGAGNNQLLERFDRYKFFVKIKTVTVILVILSTFISKLIFV